MGQLTRVVAAAATGAAIASASMLAIGTGTAVADGTGTSGPKMVPLNSYLRRCDFTSVPYVPSQTKGTGYAIITRTGNTVTAEVHMITVIPDIWYGVRLVQMPRPGIGCDVSGPGVAMGRLYTDGAGTGTTTVSGPLMQGATGAWVSVEGPLGDSNQLTGDFRTSDYVAKI
jgi:hypothetical protein